MHQYLVDTQYCSKELFKLVFDEKHQLKTLECKKNDLEKYFQFLWEQYRESKNCEDTSDVQLQNRYMKASDIGTQLKNLESQIRITKNSISFKEFSLKTLAGSILQIAKQGISIVHSSLQNCPTGKSIGQETLKNVIWQGRNQALHFEDASFNQSVTQCFNNLEQDFGINFCLSPASPENKALYVLEILDWETYEKYEADMDSIL